MGTRQLVWGLYLPNSSRNGTVSEGKINVTDNLTLSPPARATGQPNNAASQVHLCQPRSRGQRDSRGRRRGRVGAARLERRRCEKNLGFHGFLFGFLLT